MHPYVQRALRSTMFWLVVLILVLAVLRVFIPRGGFDEVATGATPLEVGANEAGLWVLNYEDESVSLVDPDARDVTFTADVGPVGPAFSVNADGAWVILDAGQTVAVVDEDSGGVAQRVDVSEVLDDPAQDVAAGDGVVWITTAEGGQMVRLDTATGELGEPVELGENVVQPDVVGDDLWAHITDGIARFDLETGEQQQLIETEQRIHDFAVDHDGVWALVNVDNLEGTGELVKFDLEDGAEQGGRLHFTTRPSHLTTLDDRVFVSSAEGLVYEIGKSPVALAGDEQITASTKDLRGLVAIDNELWVADGLNGVAWLEISEAPPVPAPTTTAP
jgi:hypothetical protein